MIVTLRLEWYNNHLLFQNSTKSNNLHQLYRSTKKIRTDIKIWCSLNIEQKRRISIKLWYWSNLKGSGYYTYIQYIAFCGSIHFMCFNFYVLEYGLAVSLKLKYRLVFSVPCTGFYTNLLEYPTDVSIKLMEISLTFHQKFLCVQHCENV